MIFDDAELLKEDAVQIQLKEFGHGWAFCLTFPDGDHYTVPHYATRQEALDAARDVIVRIDPKHLQA